MQKGPSWGPDGRWLRTEAEARRRPVNGGGEMHRSELATSEPTQILRLPTGRMKRPAYLNMTMPPTKVTQSPAPHAVANARRWTNLAAASAEAQRVGREEEPRGEERRRRQEPRRPPHRAALGARDGRGGRSWRASVQEDWREWRENGGGALSLEWKRRLGREAPLTF